MILSNPVMPRPAPAGAKRLLQAVTDLPSKLRRPVPGGAYQAEIDGLRFFAIVTVVIGHALQRSFRFFPVFAEKADSSPFAHWLHFEPALGVFLFFAISGYVIATQAQKSKESLLSAGFLKAYFGRRVMRIEPPYVLLVVATWLLLTLTGYRPEHTNQFFTRPDSLALSLIGSVVYLHDLVWGAFPRLFPPGWTLEVEVQFYIAAPLLIWAWRRCAGGVVRTGVAVAVALGACAFASAAPDQIGPLHLHYSILRYFQFFWIGVVLADARAPISAMMSRAPAWTGTAIGWGGFVALLSLPAVPEEGAPITEFVLRIIAVVAVASMFASAFAEGSRFRSFCSRPWIAMLGGACYSIYLVHMQILQTLAVAFAKRLATASPSVVVALTAIEVGLAFVVGMVFYAVVERPFMAKDWPARARRGIVALGAPALSKLAPLQPIAPYLGAAMIGFVVIALASGFRGGI